MHSQASFYSREDNVPWSPNCAILTEDSGLFRVVTLSQMRASRKDLIDPVRDICDDILVSAIITTAAIRDAMWREQ